MTIETRHKALLNDMNILSMLAGLVLLVSISCEIIGGKHTDFSGWYLVVQFIVCLIFLMDFFVHFSVADNKGRYFARNLIFLIVSIPYLNIIDLSNIPLTRDWLMGIGAIPLARAYVALYVVIRWLVSRGVKQLLVAYIATVVVCTYIAALIFFDYEVNVNTHLDGFGNALWWAWMSVTTVGAAIFPVTTIGKILAAFLPLLGMLMLPIFTTYVLSIYKKD